ncbi:MAG: Gfo/Idh/MocA family oxidoreductase [Calditrichales bacterium]|nr:MAG: Gfo/Idh/MocA family oxidoreductase [Calditrichales bacterium]
MQFHSAKEVTIVGGGMISELQILPSLYHLQRHGAVGNINICALNTAPLRKIAANQTLLNAFPGHYFKPHPDFNTLADDHNFPELYKEVITGMEPRNIVFIALPDHMHYDAVMFAIKHDQHVLCVKPLAMSYAEAEKIRKAAHRKGLFVGIEYHKRFDDRVGMARQKYRQGDFGEFRMGYATLVEPWFYRDSNFQNWCTTEFSDMFSYIGCHYVDQVHVITGLLPVRISVYSPVDLYPNNNKGYLWTNARVIWENGASLSVLNGMGYPNAGPGGNAQGLWMFTQGKYDGGIIFHDDQYRGVKHSYINKASESGESFYNEPSPDYFKLIDRGGEGLTPVGYGYRSIEALVGAVQWIESETHNLSEEKAISRRKEILKKIDAQEIIATPANSTFNELVIEAGRMSLLNDGREVVINYGKEPGVRFKV